ncbi:MAG: hypothetical protein GY778_14895, partial [bacterium]|nr:hypothetical protein [bacterium]
LTRDGFDAENPTSTPDGNWIVYWSSNLEKIGVWKIRRDGSDATRLVPGPCASTEVSPEGSFVSFLDIQPGNLRTVIRVVELESGSMIPFEIEVAHHPGARLVWGRHRWLPDGRSIAFVGADENGLTGVFVQDFRPGEDTTASRRKLAGFSTDYATESFGFSPDGSRLTLSGIEEVRSLMLADRIPNVEPPARGAPSM